MTDRDVAGPAIAEGAGHADQLRTLGEWCKAKGWISWASVCTESAAEIDRLHEQLRALQQFNLN